VGTGGRRKQYGGGPDVGADDVGSIQAERVGGLKDELSHRLGVHQRLAIFRSTKAGRIDSDQVRGGHEMRPSWLGGVYAFRTTAHQDHVGTVLGPFGVADRQSVNRDCLRVDQGAHRYSLSGRSVWQGCQSWTRRSAEPTR